MKEEGIFEIVFSPEVKKTVKAVVEDGRCVSLKPYRGVVGKDNELTAPLVQLSLAIRNYLAGKTLGIDYPFALNVPDFEYQVLEEVANIPRGSTMTYKELAQKIGRPGAYRAVGHALATNPLPLFVPCHRVVPGNGKPGKYIFGSEAKQILLSREKATKKG